MLQNSTLIGKRVRYSSKKDTFVKGIVLDKIDMLQSDKEQEPGVFPPVITGYMIENEDDGQTYAVAYWRIKEILSLRARVGQKQG